MSFIFAHFVVMSNTSNAVLNKSNERNLCLVPGLTEKTFSLLRLFMLTVDYLSDVLYQIEKVLLYSSFAESFYNEHVIKRFFCIH